MFPDRVKYTESGYDIQNNDVFYKIDQQCQNTFELFFLNWKFSKNVKNPFFLIYYAYKLQDSNFVMFVTFVICGFWDYGVFIFCIFINYYIHILTNTSATTSPNTSPDRLDGLLPEYHSFPEHSAPRAEEPRIVRTYFFLRILVKGMQEECSPRCSKHTHIYINI